MRRRWAPSTRARGQHARAEAYLQRAVEVVSAGQRAQVQLLLAQVLWDRRADRPRAIALAREALQHHQQSGNPRGAEEAERWLAAHPAP